MSRAHTPAMSVITRYWSEGWADSRDRVLSTFGDKLKYTCWDDPFCFGCTWKPPIDDEDATLPQLWTQAASWLERAHIVPVSFGGDNDCYNLVPLCRACHRTVDNRVLTREVMGRIETLRAIIDLPPVEDHVQVYTNWRYGRKYRNDVPGLLWTLERMSRVGLPRDLGIVYTEEMILREEYGVQSRQLVEAMA
jgi:hypothetical protein